jgi:hypothetical protein
VRVVSRRRDFYKKGVGILSRVYKRRRIGFQHPFCLSLAMEEVMNEVSGESSYLFLRTQNEFSGTFDLC